LTKIWNPILGGIGSFRFVDVLFFVRSIHFCSLDSDISSG